LGIATRLVPTEVTTQCDAVADPSGTEQAHQLASSVALLAAHRLPDRRV